MARRGSSVANPRDRPFGRRRFTSSDADVASKGRHDLERSRVRRLNVYRLLGDLRHEFIRRSLFVKRRDQEAEVFLTVKQLGVCSRTAIPDIS